ncbi:MAG: hypothetical protein II822_06500 [Prevotella sp.]|nr:hypothetical protein [Prevotella sp.]
MRKKSTGKGLMLVGSLRKSGITVYLRQGQMITRTAHSEERRSCTLSQFVCRQKMRHTIALWKMLKFCETWFTERQTAYQNFASLANRLPAVYVTKALMDQASFLMPGIPVSDGTLPTVRQELGEVDGTPALTTDLKAGEWPYEERLLLYTGVQENSRFEPCVRFSMREVSRADMTAVDGHLALVDEAFADNMKGWALVRVINDRCSPQTIVTRCTLYEQYSTEEALEAAADSYGGLTKSGILSGG